MPDILPLPLVPFEELMLADDRQAYPMNILCRLRFSGRLDLEMLESAAQTALARHPLLSATIERSGRKRFRWVAREQSQPVVRRVPMPPEGSYVHVDGIDLSTEMGVRMLVSENRQSTDVLVQFHHACCDAQGAFRYFEDTVIAYAKAAGERSHRLKLRPLNPEHLLRRGTFGLTPGKLIGILSKQLGHVPRVVRMALRSVSPIVPHRPQPSGSPVPDNFPTAVTRRFDVDESARLQAAALRLDVTTNDLLIRDLLLSLADWKSRQGEKLDRRWLRVWVPVNLRTMSDRRLPASNVTSVVFIDRPVAACGDPDRLLEGIHREMDQVKSLQLGLILVLSLRALKALTGSLSLAAWAGRCRATTVLTNLGEFFDKTPLPRDGRRIVLGDAVLESIDLLAPLRPYTCGSFAVFRYAGQTSVTLHYDPRTLNTLQAEDLLDSFVQQVRRSLGVGEPAKAKRRTTPNRSTSVLS